jgi:transposase
MEKKLPQQIADVMAEHPQATFALWAMDEHRIGIKPVLRRIWARQGQRPTVSVQMRYKWCYLYGFVCPESGQTFWLILPRVSTEAFSQALAELARHLGVDRNRRIILILDQAGWHTSAKVDLPEGIHLVYQPAYSPELQPSEHLWHFTDEPLTNRRFETIEELVDVQAERCRQLRAMPEIIRSATAYHWWPVLAYYRERSSEFGIIQLSIHNQ